MVRTYKQAAIWDARIASMRNLWEPSTEYMGRAVDKPNYLVTIVIKKTRANWWDEPALSSFVQSCKALYDVELAHVGFNNVVWPIKDGDVPDVGRTAAAWRAGNWILNGSSTSPIEVFINQGGVPTPLRNRAGVKPGDYVSVTTSIAVKTNDPRGIKVYINKVVFLAEGEEIVLGSSTSAAELMEQARAQGMNVTGFGGGGAPSQGFGFAPSVAGAPQFAPAPPMGSAPFPSNPNVAGTNNGQIPGFGQAGTGGLAPPPVQPPARPGFKPGDGFMPPTGFPPRQ